MQARPSWNLQLLEGKSADASVSGKRVVKNTRRVLPGLYVAGAAVTALHGLPRMGPVFGGMPLSGK